MSSEEKDAQVEKTRHSAAHVMAEAVKSIFPDAKFGIGPAIESGFYYDFDLPRALIPDDLPIIEAKMSEIINSNHEFIRKEIDINEAKKIFADQPYKLDLLCEFSDKVVTIYQQGSFIDLCKGPHVNSTGDIKTFKLTTIAGAYWRGDEKRPMLQ